MKKTSVKQDEKNMVKTAEDLSINYASFMDFECFYKMFDLMCLPDCYWFLSIHTMYAIYVCDFLVY